MNIYLKQLKECYNKIETLIFRIEVNCKHEFKKVPKNIFVDDFICTKCGSVRNLGELKDIEVNTNKLKPNRELIKEIAGKKSKKLNNLIKKREKQNKAKKQLF